MDTKGKTGMELLSMQTMMHIGDQVPDFTAESSHGEIKFYDYIGDNWACLFSHPKDFTPVCTTELGRVAQLKDEFAARKIKVIALSCDSLASHAKWKGDIETSQNCTVDFPIIADSDRRIAVRFGMLDQTRLGKAGMPEVVRSVFFIGPDKYCKALITYPASTGRNFNEILRVFDSLQLTASKKVVTPADWQKGKACIIGPSIPDDDAKKIFGTYNSVLPYLREVPDPSSPTAK